MSCCARTRADIPISATMDISFWIVSLAPFPIPISLRHGLRRFQASSNMVFSLVSPRQLSALDRMAWKYSGSSTESPRSLRIHNQPISIEEATLSRKHPETRRFGLAFSALAILASLATLPAEVKAQQAA